MDKEYLADLIFNACSMASFEKNEKQSFSKGWIKVPSKTYPDRVYYYNTKTKCSWTNPCKEADKSISNLESKKIGKNVAPTLSSSLSLTNRKRKKKKKKSNSITNLSASSKINNNIEDYDEHQEQYFESVLGEGVSPSLRKSDISNNSAAKQNTSDETCKTFRISSQTNHDGNDGKSLSEAASQKETQKDGKIRFKIPSQNRLLQLRAALRKNRAPELKEMTAKQCLLGGKVSPNVETIKGSSLKEKTPAQEKLLKLRKTLMNSHHVKETEGEQHFLVSNKTTPLVSECVNFESNFAKDENDHLLETKLKKLKDLNSRNKTPAQVKLLKLRRQLSQEIDGMLHPWEKSLKKTSLDVRKKFQPFSFSSSNSEPKKDIIRSRSSSSDDSGDNLNFVEEMDWDPIDEESDAKFINEFCEQMDVCKEILPDAYDKMNSLNCFSTLSNSWILVPDTNIFVADLIFIHDIRDVDVPGLGYPIIYVPWRVLQELDYLKDSKIDSQKKRLSVNARKSISYINENFRSKQSRFCGQSFEDFMNMVNTNVSNPDDEILETCLKLRKQHADKKVILLTNDKNLESKAIVSNLEAYAKDEFKIKFLSQRTNCDGREIDYVQSEGVEREIKNLLNGFISKVVENEMEKAFGADWIKICHKRPPWTLQDSLTCFIKHWRSVFFLLYSKDVFTKAEKLYRKLYKSSIGFSPNYTEVLHDSVKLINSFKIIPKNYVPYQKLGDEILEKLSNLDKSKSDDMSIGHTTQEKLPLDFVPESSNSLGNKIEIGGESQSVNLSDDFALVKNLFLNIWESLKSFCASVFELIQQGDLSNSNQMSEARLKLHETYTKVSNLISLLALLVKVRIDYLGESHTFIVQLNDYLVDLFRSMLPADVQKKLRKALVIFCSSLEGRSVIEKLLSELTAFTGCLLEAKNYLDSCFSQKS